ncbi:MAG: DUF2085 domain-containing protein [Chloroflexi bacterium]|nr:DUF2085 domain-containing protein [Chloroflexota bacterium]
MLQITFYTRKDCKLCDQAVEHLEALQEDFPHKITFVDIDEEDDLKEAYQEKIPVLVVGPFTLEAPFDRKKMRVTLGAAQDSSAGKQKYEGEKYRKQQERKQHLSTGDRISYWFSRNYLKALNGFIFLYVGLPFLAPILMNAGLTGMARPIYSIYGAACHQLAFRSWFLFGEQEAYPRLAAGVEGLTTYGDATGLSEENLWEARNYIGNEQLGYKVAFCERDVAIWGAMLLFGLIYAYSKRRIPPLPWYVWFIIGIGPIGLDGFSQLLSQLPNFSLWEYRESTPFLRTLTGGIFGFTTAWFGFPLVEETMLETRTSLAAKIARLKKTNPA